MSRSIKTALELKRISANTFQNAHPLIATGKLLPAVYGGLTLALCVNAGCQTVPDDLKVYTVFASYLGPALTSEALTFRVEEIRETRNFATRQVIAEQIQKGVKRKVMIMLLDFQREEASLMEYSAQPRLKYSSPENTPVFSEHLQKRVREGSLSQKTADSFKIVFPINSEFSDHETRYLPEGIGLQNLYGIDKRAKTSQDHLSITEKTTAIYHRTSIPLETQGERAGLVAFVTDGALAFLPLIFSNKFLDDAGAAASLDVSLRFHRSDWKSEDWLLSEQYTEAAGFGRNYATFRTWDKEGRLVATMSQQCILRPKADAAKASAKL